MSQNLSMWHEVLDLTPVRAKELLDLSLGNRPTSLTRVARYRKEMRAGKWYRTGDSICVSKPCVGKCLTNNNPCVGHLLNGHHRCLALWNGGDYPKGLTAPMTICYNVDNASVDYMDIGKRRTGSDILQIAETRSGGAPIKYTKERTTIARGMIGGFSIVPGTNEKDREIRDFALKHHKIIMPLVSLHKEVPGGVAAAFGNAILVGSLPAHTAMTWADCLANQKFSNKTEPLRLLSLKLKKIKDFSKAIPVRYSLTVEALRLTAKNSKKKSIEPAVVDFVGGEFHNLLWVP